MKQHLEDWLLYLGLALVVGGVALLSIPAALIAAGLFIAGVAIMRAYTHAT
jgi:hypothetical protein